ncbi:MAG: Mur ligase family protein [Candidatus Falkowbacteria bacterium]
MRKLLELMLRVLARGVIKKYDPEVVGVTGSIGKTSSKEAIVRVLSAKYAVRGSIRNYNNELGLPLTILGLNSPGRSWAGWLSVLIQGIKLLMFIDKDYPEVLVLEMGVDKPGDMDYLLSIVQLKAAVLTYVGTSHMEQFGTTAKLREEKAKIFNGLDRSGYAIINLDFPEADKIVEGAKNKVLTYGFAEEAEIRAQNIIYRFQDEEAASLGGVNFKIHYKDSYIPVLIPAVIGHPTIYAALAGAAVGFAFGLNGIEISEALRAMEPPKGRLHLIAGKNGSMIIDDTYNAAPQSTLAALEVLDSIKQPAICTKWVVLGDMLELGSESEKGHSEIGQRVADIAKARLLYIGKQAHYYGMGARKAEMAEERIQAFNNHQEVIEYLEIHLKPHDLVLVKGSQGMRMEKIVKALMAEPQTAGEQLVRQGADWQN